MCYSVVVLFYELTRNHFGLFSEKPVEVNLVTSLESVPEPEDKEG